MLCLLLLLGCYRGSHGHIAVACTRPDNGKRLARLWSLRQSAAAVALEGGNALIAAT